MDSDQVPTGNSHQDQMINSATDIPQLTHSSPIPEPLSEQDVQYDQASTLINSDERGESEGKAIEVDLALVPTHSIPAEEESQRDEPVSLFECPHCDKTYTSAKSLKRHTNDKKSVCVRAREAANSTDRWACPRCQAHMSKRFSVERHIKDSCWKICDQCCESDSFHCDASNKDEDCTTCEKIGKSCTKHTKPVPDCVAVPLIGAQPKSNNACRRIKAATLITHQKREKRRAAQSPSSSPQSKPKTKRKTRGNKKGQTNFRATTAAKDEERNAKDQNTAFVPQNASPNRSPPPAKTFQPLQNHADALRHGLLPSLAVGRHCKQYSTSVPHQDLETQLTGFYDAASGQHTSYSLPPISDRGSYRLTASSQYARSMQEMIQRQVQAVQGMGLAPQYASGYGNGGYPAPVISSSRSSLNIGHDTWGAPQSRGTGQLGARESPCRSFQNHQDQSTHHPEDTLSGLSRQNSGNLSHQPSIPNGQPSADGSRVSSRQHLVEDGQLLAPESYKLSRPSSRQSSVEELHSPINSTPSNQPDTDTKFVIKLPLPHEVQQKLSIEPIGPTPTVTSNPILHIRIHSNTYDSDGLPIFSILTLHLHDIFGPRLAYYCAQRGTRYGTDWKFVYQYPAPTSEKPHRQKYFDITYNMKPAHAQDREYPGHAMRDGDTIFVVGRRADAPANEDDIGEQIECQHIAIQNGETPIYQDKSVNDAWYKDAERQLSVTRNQLGNMRNAAIQARQLRATHETRIAELEAVNAVLRGEVETLRRQYQQPQQQAYVSQDEVAYRRYMLQQQESLPGHVRPNGYVQEQSEYAPGSMAEYLHSRGYRVPLLERRQGPVRDAGDRVAPVDDE